MFSDSKVGKHYFERPHSISQIRYTDVQINLHQTLMSHDGRFDGVLGVV